MKKLFFAFVFVLVFVSNAFAVELNLQYTKQVPTSDNFGDFDGIKLSIAPNDSIFYLWASGDHGRLTLGSQQFTYLDLIGVGVGIKKRFDGFQIFADIGWFEPFCKQNGAVIRNGEDGFDRLWIHLNDKYGNLAGTQDFDYYKMSISGNFGGNFGIKFFYKIKKKYEIYGLAGYRILSLPMIVESWGNINGWNWNRFENENLSGPFVGIGFNF